MTKDRRHLTEKILNFTLEIMYLLTGEDYIIVKLFGNDITHGSSGTGEWNRIQTPIMRPPHVSLIREGNHENRVLELTNKMIALLTGEVPIRCEDVAVYLSMEEQEYFEEHKELYEAAMLEDQLPPTPTDFEKNMEECPDHDAERNDLSQVPEDVMDLKIHSSQDPAEDLMEQKIYISQDPAEDLMEQKIYISQDPAEDIMEQKIYISQDPAEDIMEQKIYISQDPAEDLMDVKIHISKYPAEDIMHQKIHISQDPAEDVVDQKIHISQEPAEDIVDLQIHTSQDLEEDPTDPKIYVSPDPREDLIDLKIHPGLPSTDAFRYPSMCGDSPSDVIPFIHHGFSSVDGLPQSTEEPTLVNLHSIVPNFQPTHHISDSSPDSSQAKEFLHSRPNATTDGSSDIRFRIYACPECSKCFPKNAELVRHLRTHTGERPYSCSECNKCFTQNANLIRHQRIHTGVRPFACPECGKRFSGKSDVSRHQKVHLLKKPWLCYKCCRSFSRKSDFDRHQDSHK